MLLRIHLLELIRFFFVLLYSYLSDFAWIIRSKNFAKTLSFSSAPFPVFCECKGTTFSFPSNTFNNFFLKKFTFSASH